MHTIVESLIDHGYSGNDNGAKVCHFLQEIGSIELEAVVSVVWAQPKEYDNDLDATVSYFGQVVMKNGYKM